MIELHRHFTLTTPEGTISTTGIQQIVSLIQNQNRQNAAWMALETVMPIHSWLPALPEIWQWTWLVQSGEYIGTFPKRVAHYYYKAHGIKCPLEFISQIGNLARMHSAARFTYEFDFVDRFDWEDGDFGDGGSCYWADRARARVMLIDHGALAIRFFDTQGKGYGRAWIARIDDSLKIVFNGYGFAGNATLTAARVLASFLDLSYRRIYLSNNGIESGTLWINGSLGYAVGKAEVIDQIERYDLEWEDDALTCENCGRAVHEDDVYYGPDDLPYCERCFYDHFETCSLCGAVCDQEDILTVEDEYLCQRCLERHCVNCDNCGQYVFARNAVYAEKEEAHYCQECAPDDESESEDENEDAGDP